MDAALNPANAMALFIGLVVLAAVPSTSVLIVAARAASAGFRHGALATLGIVVGDVIFITIAVFGLVFLAAALGPWFVVVKALAGGYLVWLGLRTWASASAASGASGYADPSRRSSFLAGLLFTLGDQKAILFYFGFFPAFMELDRLSGSDAALIMLIAVVAVGGVKLAYAWAAERAVRIAGSHAGAWLARLAGTLMIAVGAFLLISVVHAWVQ